MNQSKKAYGLSIDEGKVRIVIKIEDLKVDLRNSAEEFISAKDDKIYLFLKFTDLDIKINQEKGYKLKGSFSKGEELVSLELDQESIWFDVQMSEMSNILNNTIQFSIAGKYPKHLSYFIKKLDFKIEWLQYDKQKDSISTVSVTKKSFSQSHSETDLDYTHDDISKASELLGRAIKKIDLRTGSSYVRLNTENGRLDPILITIAEKLGYQLEVLNEETINDLNKRGRKASHIISLMINY
jgi:hypothetical protein